MEVVELKFLLALLAYPPDYHTALSELRPTESRSDRNRACRQLRDRNLIGCSDEIIQFKTSASGNALIKLVSASSESASSKAKTAAKSSKTTKTKTTKTKAKKGQTASKKMAKAKTVKSKAAPANELPVTRDELKALNAGTNGFITPGKAMKGVNPQKRQKILQELDTRGLIQSETQIKDVWLTPQGREFLINDCHPDGNHTVSFNFLRNCMDFFRGELKRGPAVTGTDPSLQWTQSTKPDEADVLAMILTLDEATNSQNYLPLFHLRQALQPPLSQDELDQLLYQLQRQDKIELGSLQDAIAYTPDQIKAGIPQDIGGPLFFVSTV